MAAYASSVTNYTNGVERISRGLGMLCGRIDITNYNSTTTEETSITRYFKASSQSGLEKGIISLQVTSSENGYVLGFDKSTGKFKAYYAPAHAISNIALSTSDTYTDNAVNTAVNAITATAAALSEVANDTDLGTFDFVAIGFLA